MAEYIERAAAIKRIKEYSLTAYQINLDNEEEFAGNSLPENYCEGLYEVTELLDDLPAADVAEVRHGRWIGLEYDGYADGNPVYDLWECSECGEEVRGEDVPSTHPWCHSCGARMDKQSEVALRREREDE